MWIKHRDQRSPFPFLWCLDGGGDNGGSGDQAPAGAGDTPPSADAGGDEQGQQAPEGKPEQPPAGETAEAKAARLEAEVSRLRRENGSQRVTAKQKAADEAKAELAQQIGKALGIVKDDEPVDPERLAADLQTAQQQAREARVHLAVHQTAGTAGADPLALLDSSSFLAKVGTLDPTADGFAGKVEAAIKEAVAANPRLKAEGQAPTGGKGGADVRGGNPDRGARQPKTLADALSGHYS